MHHEGELFSPLLITLSSARRAELTRRKAESSPAQIIHVSCKAFAAPCSKALTDTIPQLITTFTMKIFSSILILMLFFMGSGLTTSAFAAKSVRKSSKMSTIKTDKLSRFEWSKLLGITIEVKFGTNIPGCPCCYGGVCEFKIGSSAMISGPVDDNQVRSFSDELLANDQGIIGITQSGETYLIFSRHTTRPELLGKVLDVQAPPRWDPQLSTVYGIPPMKAGKYQIVDNGLFKAVRLN